MADPTPPIPPPKHTTRSVHPPQHQAQRHSDPVAPAIASQPPSTRPMIHQHRHPLHPHSAVPISQSSAPLAAHQDAGSNCPNQSTQTPAPDPDPTRPSLRSAQPTSPSSGEKSPLSRLLHHFITKPTLSRTWENRSYAEEQRSAPPAVGMTEIPSGDEMRRPRSLYASPGDVAAFRPLPPVGSSAPGASDSRMV